MPDWLSGPGSVRAGKPPGNLNFTPRLNAMRKLALKRLGDSAVGSDWAHSASGTAQSSVRRSSRPTKWHLEPLDRWKTLNIRHPTSNIPRVLERGTLDVECSRLDVAGSPKFMAWADHKGCFIKFWALS